MEKRCSDQGGRRSIFDEEADYLCSICFYVEPHALLDTIGVIGTNSLSYSGGCQIGIHADDNHRFVAVVYRTRNSRPVFRQVGFEWKINGILNKVSALVVWSVAVYMAIRLTGNIG